MNHLIQEKITFNAKWQVVHIIFFRIMHEQSFTAEYRPFFFISIANFLAFWVYLASNSASCSQIYAKPNTLCQMMLLFYAIIYPCRYSKSQVYWKSLYSHRYCHSSGTDQAILMFSTTSRFEHFNHSNGIKLYMKM